MTPQTILRKWPWTALASIAVLILSVIPIPDNPPLGEVPLIDKWVHFVMYGGVVCALWFDKLISRQKRGRMLFAILALTYAAALGGLMEILQSMTAYRNGDWIDLLADIVGAVMATLICLPLHSLFTTHKYTATNLS